jgi:hypothetical protein
MMPKAHDLAVKTLGHLVVDCDATKAALNNSMFKKALEGGYQVQSSLKNQSSRKSLLQGHVGSPAPTPTKAPESPKSQEVAGPPAPGAAPEQTFKGITNAVAGELYRGFWRSSRQWYVVMVLGWGHQLVCGMDKDLQSIGLTVAKGRSARVSVPKCYVLDDAGTSIADWAPGYEDGGPLVHKRNFPVLFFDNERSVAWLPAKALAPFDPDDPRYNDSLSPKSFVAEAMHIYAQARGFNNWADMMAKGGRYTTHRVIISWKLENERFTTPPFQHKSSASTAPREPVTGFPTTEHSRTGLESDSVMEAEPEDVDMFDDQDPTLQRTTAQGGEDPFDDDYVGTDDDVVMQDVPRPPSRRSMSETHRQSPRNRRIISEAEPTPQGAPRPLSRRGTQPTSESVGSTKARDTERRESGAPNSPGKSKDPLMKRGTLSMSQPNQEKFGHPEIRRDSHGGSSHPQTSQDTGSKSADRPTSSGKSSKSDRKKQTQPDRESDRPRSVPVEIHASSISGMSAKEIAARAMASAAGSTEPFITERRTNSRDPDPEVRNSSADRSTPGGRTGTAPEPAVQPVVSQSTQQPKPTVDDLPAAQVPDPNPKMPVTLLGPSDASKPTAVSSEPRRLQEINGNGKGVSAQPAFDKNAAGAQSTVLKASVQLGTPLSNSTKTLDQPLVSQPPAFSQSSTEARAASTATGKVTPVASMAVGPVTNTTGDSAKDARRASTASIGTATGLSSGAATPQLPAADPIERWRAVRASDSPRDSPAIGSGPSEQPKEAPVLTPTASLKSDPDAAQFFDLAAYKDTFKSWSRPKGSNSFLRLEYTSESEIATAVLDSPLPTVTINAKEVTRMSEEVDAEGRNIIHLASGHFQQKLVFEKSITGGRITNSKVLSRRFRYWLLKINPGLGSFGVPREK